MSRHRPVRIICDLFPFTADYASTRHGVALPFTWKWLFTGNSSKGVKAVTTCICAVPSAIAVKIQDPKPVGIEADF